MAHTDMMKLLRRSKSCSPSWKMLPTPKQQTCANSMLVYPKQKALLKRALRLNSTTPRIVCLIPLLGAYAIERYRSMPSKGAQSTRSFCHQHWCT
ncbi:hypothetical protein BDR05DRAFT_84064 [Suillus weaverae]|nr:hypothetical protein BDR05DRAFT_84064 [Suillus weaverae]